MASTVAVFKYFVALSNATATRTPHATCLPDALASDHAVFDEYVNKSLDTSHGLSLWQCAAVMRALASEHRLPVVVNVVQSDDDDCGPPRDHATTAQGELATATFAQQFDADLRRYVTGPGE